MTPSRGQYRGIRIARLHQPPTSRRHASRDESGNDRCARAGSREPSPRGTQRRASARTTRTEGVRDVTPLLDIGQTGVPTVRNGCRRHIAHDRRNSKLVIGLQVEIGHRGGGRAGDLRLANLVAELESACTPVLEHRHPHAGSPRPDRIAQTFPRHGRPAPTAGRFAVPNVDPEMAAREELHRLEPTVSLIIRYLSDRRRKRSGGQPRHHRHQEASPSHALRVPGDDSSARGDASSHGSLEKGERWRCLVARADQTRAREPDTRAEQLSSCNFHAAPHPHERGCASDVDRMEPRCTVPRFSGTASWIRPDTLGLFSARGGSSHEDPVWAGFRGRGPSDRKPEVTPVVHALLAA